MGGIFTEPIERFMGFVEKTDSCWIWRGPYSKRNSVPAFAHKNEDGVSWTKTTAPRWIWMHLGREIPPKFYVMRTCKNKMCVNPDHLKVAPPTGSCGKRGPYSVRGNKKRCNGPLHNGEYIPLTEFWMVNDKRKGGKYYNARCKTCEAFKKTRYNFDGQHGMVPLDRVYFIFDELIRRLGLTEAARRIGISSGALHNIKIKKYEKTRKYTAYKAMNALREVRENREVRHKKSIRHGAHLRGRKERIPVAMSEFYAPAGRTQAEIELDKMVAGKAA